MNKLHILPFLILISLIHSASAGSVTRIITYNDVYFNSTYLYKEANITLSPTPYTDFNTPGYFITEYIPNGLVFIDTNADQYKLENNTLRMLKFNPPTSNLQLSYTLRIPKDPGTYTIYGSFQDKNRKVGEIKAQDITVQSTQSGQPQGGSGSITISTSNPPSSPALPDQEPVKVESAKITEITAQQAQLTSEQSSSPIIPFILVGIIALSIIAAVLIKKRLKKLSPTYEFIN